MPQTTEHDLIANYSSRFPNLVSALCSKRTWLRNDLSAFANLLSVAEAYYPMFSFAALNQSADNIDGTYLCIFLEMMPNMRPSSVTPRALKSAIDEKFRTGTILFNEVTSGYLIVPSKANEYPNASMGLLESIAMRPTERALKPLSLLDFSRLRKCFIKKESYFFGDYYDFLQLADDKKPPFALLNITELDQPPKWIAVCKASDGKRVVFSQAMLTQEESAYFPEDQYHIIAHQKKSEPSDVYYALTFLLERAREAAALNTPTTEFQAFLTLINSASDIETVKMVLTTLMAVCCQCQFYDCETLEMDPVVNPDETRLSKIKKNSLPEQLAFFWDHFSTINDPAALSRFSLIPGFYKQLIDIGAISKERNRISLLGFEEKQKQILVSLRSIEKEDFIESLLPTLYEITPAQLAIASLIAFFSNHAFATEVAIRLDPSLDIDEATLAPLIEMLSTRYALTKIELGTTPNKVHALLAKKVAPLLERNRWLDRHHCHLSASDSIETSMKKSAEFFLDHISCGKPFTGALMHSWKVMGTALFGPVLGMLDNHFIRQSLFPRNHQRAIYLCMDEDIFHALKKHIEKHNGFPFKKWVIDIDEINNAQLIALIELANQIGTDSVVLTCRDWSKRDSLHAFFQSGKEKNWKTTVRIPLDDTSAFYEAYAAFSDDIKERRKEESTSRQAILASLTHGIHKPLSASLQPPINREMFEKFTRMSSGLVQPLPLASHASSVDIQQEQQQQEQQQQSVERATSMECYKRAGRSRAEMGEVEGPIVDRDSVGSFFSEWFEGLQKYNVSLYDLIKKEFIEDHSGEDAEAFTTENALVWLFDKICDAPVVGFTVKAAALLLENVRCFFISGLNLDNLSPGLEIVRDAEGKAVVSFDPTRANEGNHFTVLLHQKPPQALATYSEAYIKRRLDAIKHSPTELTDNDIALFDQFTATKPAALFQLLDQRGATDVVLFIKMMRVVQKRIGTEAFTVLKNHFLSRSDDFSVFASDTYFHVFKEIAEKLPKNTPENKLFFKLLSVHMRFVEWVDLQNIWNAFQVFLRTMQKLNIIVPEDMFESFTGMNALISLERIIVICLRANPEDRQYFVNNLWQYDLGHTGVYTRVTVQGETSIANPIFWHDAFHGCDLSELSEEDPEECVKKLILENASKNISKKGIDALIAFGESANAKSFSKESFKKIFLMAIHVCDRSGPDYFQQWMAAEGLGTFLMDIFTRKDKVAISLIDRFMKRLSCFPNRSNLNLDALLMILKKSPSHASKLKMLLDAENANPNPNAEEMKFFIFEMCSIAARKDLALQKEKSDAIAAVAAAEKKLKEAKKAVLKAKEAVAAATESARKSTLSVAYANEEVKKTTAADRIEHVKKCQADALEHDTKIKKLVETTQQEESAARAAESAASIAAQTAKTANEILSKKREALDQLFEGDEPCLLKKMVDEVGKQPDATLKSIYLFAIKYSFRLEKDCVNVLSYKHYKDFLAILLSNHSADKTVQYGARIKAANDYFMSETASFDKGIVYSSKEMAIPRVFSAKDSFEEKFPIFCDIFQKILHSPGSVRAEKNKIQPPSIKAISKTLCERCITKDLAIYPQREIVSSLLSQFVVKHNDVTIGEIVEPLLFLLSRIAEKSEGDLIAFCNAMEEKIKGKPLYQLEFFEDILSVFVECRIKNAFPFFMLPTLFEEMDRLTRDTKKVKKALSHSVKDALSTILKESEYSVSEKKQLIKLVLRLDYWTDADSAENIDALLTLLSRYQKNPASRVTVLSLLERCGTHADYEKIKLYCDQTTLDESYPDTIRRHWDKTHALYLRQLLKEDASPALLTIIDEIKNDPHAPYLMHIAAWSTWSSGHKSQAQQTVDREKLPKLLLKLKKLPRNSLEHIASYCTEIQSVRGNTLRRIVKYHTDDEDRKNALDKDRQFYDVDSRGSAGEHDANFKRIVNNIVWTENDQPRQLTAIEKIKIASMRAKLIESAKKISNLDLDKLKDLFSELQFKQISLKKAPQQSESDYRGQLMDLKIAQLAVLFKIMRCTIGIYPNLAQQLSMLLAEMVDSPCPIFTLDTGEGKSILIALRAAILAANGGHVNVGTTNLTLAKRDQEKFSAFYSALGYVSGVATATTSKKEYKSLNICYSTPGDLSLLKTAALLEEKSSADKNNNNHDDDDDVLLLDESDSALKSSTPSRYSVSFMEGLDRHDAEAFYKAVYQFYLDKVFSKGVEKIDKNLFDAFSAMLCDYAGNTESRLRFLGLFELEDVAQWLRAAHAAHHLKRDRFTVRYEDTGDADFENTKAHMIYPLSADDNNLLHATFSGGVHQLLAARVALENKDITGRVVFPPFTNIISSRFITDEIFRSYKRVEGFTATPGGDLQSGAVIFGIPTNKPSQRVWNTPEVFEDSDARLDYLIDLILKSKEQKKSILISCANDTEVQQLTEKLKKHPTLSDYADHLLAYTNDSLESPEAFLENKRKKENSVNGQKAEWTVVLSACFDRGANVEVDSVVILDASANSIRIQKGGRTARNGEPGSVFECYVKSDIIELVRAIYRSVKHVLSSEEQKKIEALLKGKSDEEAAERDEKIDPSVLVIVSKLIEHHHVISHQAENEYQKLISQFSDWAMKLISKKERADQKPLLITLIKLQKKLQKEWNTVKGNADEKAEDKINRIKNSIELSAFELSSSDVLTLETTQNQKAKLSGAKPEHTAEAISHSATNLMLSYLAHTASALAGSIHYAEALGQLAKHVTKMIPYFDLSSPIPFADRLKTTDANEKSSGSLYSELFPDLKPTEVKTLLAKTVESKIEYAPFRNILKFQPNDFRQCFLENFCLSFDASNIHDRIKQAILLLRYLERFYQDEKTEEKIQYANNLFAMLFLPTYSWVLEYVGGLADQKERKDVLVPVDHFLSLSAFVWEITEVQSTSIEQTKKLRCDLFGSLLDLSSVSTSDRVQRQLSELNAVFTQDELVKMIPAFCAVEKCAIASGNKQIIDAVAVLFKLTTNPDNHYHKPTVLKIWDQLNKHMQSPDVSFEKISGIIHFSVEKKGKFVFTVMEMLLASASVSSLAPAMLKGLGEALSATPTHRAKRDRVGLFLQDVTRHGVHDDSDNRQLIAARA